MITPAEYVFFGVLSFFLLVAAAAVGWLWWRVFASPSLNPSPESSNRRIPRGSSNREARIADLERIVDKQQEELVALRVRVAEMDGKLLTLSETSNMMAHHRHDSIGRTELYLNKLKSAI